MRDRVTRVFEAPRELEALRAGFAAAGFAAAGFSAAGSVTPGCFLVAPFGVPAAAAGGAAGRGQIASSGEPGSQGTSRDVVRW